MSRKHIAWLLIWWVPLVLAYIGTPALFGPPFLPYVAMLVVGWGVASYALVLLAGVVIGTLRS